jgi:hypothetical protein
METTRTTQKYKLGELVFHRLLVLGEVVKYYPSDGGRGVEGYSVRWRGREEMEGEHYNRYEEVVISQEDMEALKRGLVDALERYTTGGVEEIMRWERERVAGWRGI